jgi:hypothetical protein
VPWPRIPTKNMTWHKYNAKPVVLDNIRFDSKAEASRYLLLKACLRTGEISDLEVHPKYVILTGKVGDRVEKVRYVPDFRYKQEGKVVVEDVKGAITSVFRLKAKLFVMNYPDIEFIIAIPDRSSRGGDQFGYLWSAHSEYRLWELNERNKR